MAGVRIVHATKRNCWYRVIDGERPYAGEQAPCPYCGVPHTHKTYHFRLDDQGAAIVSPEIVERLKALAQGNPFSIGEEVSHPPSQVLGLHAGPPQKLVKGGGLVAPDGLPIVVERGS